MLDSFAPSLVEYQRLLPEIILTLAGTLVMLLEAMNPDKEKSYISGFAIVALIAAFLAALAADAGTAFQGMIVVEHHPAGLLVGPVKRRDAGRVVRCAHSRARQLTGAGRDHVSGCYVKPHVGHVILTGALDERGYLSGGSDPLVGRPIADPWRDAAVEMDRGAVLRVICAGRIRGRRIAGGAQAGKRAHSGPHKGGVHRQEEIASNAGRKPVGKLDAYRFVLRGQDQGPQIVSRSNGNAVMLLHVAAQLGAACWQVTMQLFIILDQCYLVIVGPGKRRSIRGRKRDILSAIVLTEG